MPKAKREKGSRLTHAEGDRQTDRKKGGFLQSNVSPGGEEETNRASRAGYGWRGEQESRKLSGSKNPLKRLFPPRGSGASVPSTFPSVSNGV